MLPTGDRLRLNNFKKNIQMTKFDRKIDFTTVNKSLTWQERFKINKDLVDHRHILESEKTPVIPKMGGFWVLDEYHEYNWKDENCISCGERFPAKFEEHIFCHQCKVNFEAEFFYYGQEKQKAWLLETYGSPYGWTKPKKKEAQMKLNF